MLRALFLDSALVRLRKVRALWKYNEPVNKLRERKHWGHTSDSVKLQRQLSIICIVRRWV